MPTIHLYLQEKLYKKVMQESKKFIDHRGRTSPSRFLQHVLRQHFMLRDDNYAKEALARYDDRNEDRMQDWTQPTDEWLADGGKHDKKSANRAQKPTKQGRGK